MCETQKLRLESVTQEVSSNEALSDFKYISMACAAISKRQYKEALQIIKRGLEDSIKSEKSYNSQEVLKWFYGLVITLDYTLEEGQSHEAKTLQETEKKIVCSFCGKGQEEAAKIIAGPNVYICAECVEICNEIVKEEAKI